VVKKKAHKNKKNYKKIKKKSKKATEGARKKLDPWNQGYWGGECSKSHRGWERTWKSVRRGRERRECRWAGSGDDGERCGRRKSTS